MRARLLVAGLLCASWALGDQSVTVGPGFSFSPSTVTVAPGEKVTWVWAGATHSSTSDATSGSDAWDSGLMTTGSFDHVFTTIGAHPYYCVLHGSPGGIGMSGVVEVVAPTTPTPTSTATPLPSAMAAPSTTPAATFTPFTPVQDPTPPQGAAVPTLGSVGMLAFALGLAALAYLVLSKAAR